MNRFLCEDVACNAYCIKNFRRLGYCDKNVLSKTCICRSNSKNEHILIPEIYSNIQPQMEHIFNSFIDAEPETELESESVSNFDKLSESNSELKMEKNETLKCFNTTCLIKCQTHPRKCDQYIPNKFITNCVGDLTNTTICNIVDFDGLCETIHAAFCNLNRNKENSNVEIDGNNVSSDMASSSKKETNSVAIAILADFQQCIYDLPSTNPSLACTNNCDNLHTNMSTSSSDSKPDSQNKNESDDEYSKERFNNEEGINSHSIEPCNCINGEEKGFYECELNRCSTSHNYEPNNNLPHCQNEEKYDFCKCKILP